MMRAMMAFGAGVLLSPAVYAGDAPAASVSSAEALVASEPVPSVSPYLSIEELEKRLKYRPEPFFQSLKKAWDGINAKRYTQAILALRQAPPNKEFEDYVHYLKGMAELGLLRTHAAAGRSPPAIAAGLRAIEQLGETLRHEPFTPLTKRAQMNLAEAEIETAEHLTGAKQAPRARLLFESGFLRLSQQELLVLVPQKSIITYALICEKKPTEICGTWVERLSVYLDKSEDLRAVRKALALKPSVRPPKKPNRTYSVALDLQAFSKGYFQYIAGDYYGAYEAWYELLKEYPNTNIKLRTKFWMGRAAQRTKHSLQALTLYKEVIRDAPFSYYAMLSSWFSNIDVLRMVDASLPTATREPQNALPQELMQVRRAEVLVANDLSDLARMELKDVRLAEAMPNEFLVYLAYLNHRARSHRVVSAIYGELSSRGYTGLFSSFGEKLLFPTTYISAVSRAASEQKIDPLIALSIIKQESSFDQEAVSPANAYGLMQIIRPTAKELDPRVTVSELLMPERNIRLGTKYIAQLLKRYSGSLVHALAAYNAGPHNADRWRRDISPDLPVEEYIELITYKETREYVQNIIRNRYWYGRIINGEPVNDLKKLSTM